MHAQSGEMGEGARTFSLDCRMQDRLEPFLFQFLGPRAFVVEQTQFGDETDVGDGDGVTDQELAIRR